MLFRHLYKANVDRQSARSSVTRRNLPADVAQALAARCAVLVLSFVALVAELFRSPSVMAIRISNAQTAGMSTAETQIIPPI